MQRLLVSILKILFPRTRAPRVDINALEEHDVLERADLRTLTLGADEVTVFFSYTDPVVRRLVWALKYERNGWAADVFVHVIGAALLEELSERMLFSGRALILAPIPLSPRRLRERGYNQVAWITERLAAHLGAQALHVPDLLARIRDTEAQTKLPRKKRLNNMEGAFAVNNASYIAHPIMLFDDVVTTGSTLRAAKAALARAGARDVRCFAIAH